jgi:hypothetical protein
MASFEFKVWSMKLRAANFELEAAKGKLSSQGLSFGS